ncbi:hypothetical protein L486_07865 [Kwoniella mangroviensis CBS 10435]|uniref:Uncharacterized protein n=1 Tax=Kwoniella mangroviensis CBS 10435 TaxID=1331196 RepID=A0A1B9IH03_9TREE|nr:hypothetical protein L486_07865 [Kwoniella mangroviensis CBS 10435]
MSDPNHPTPTSLESNIIDLTLDDDDDAFSSRSPSDSITKTSDMDLFISTTQASSDSPSTERFEDDFLLTGSNCLPTDTHIDLALASFNNDMISRSAQFTKLTNQSIPAQNPAHDPHQYLPLDLWNVSYPYEYGQYTQPYPRANEDLTSVMDEVTLNLLSLTKDLAESEKSQNESLRSTIALADKVKNRSKEVEQTLNDLKTSLMAQTPTSTPSSQSTIYPSHLHIDHTSNEHRDPDSSLERRIQHLADRNKQLEDKNERLEMSSLEYQLSFQILQGQLAEKDLQMMQFQNK